MADARENRVDINLQKLRNVLPLHAGGVETDVIDVVDGYGIGALIAMRAGPYKPAEDGEAEKRPIGERIAPLLLPSKQRDAADEKRDALRARKKGETAGEAREKKKFCVRFGRPAFEAEQRDQRKHAEG